jgi:hypothetical protein
MVCNSRVPSEVIAAEGSGVGTQEMVCDAGVVLRLPAVLREPQDGTRAVPPANLSAIQYRLNFPRHILDNGKLEIRVGIS